MTSKNVLIREWLIELILHHAMVEMVLHGTGGHVQKMLGKLLCRCNPNDCLSCHEGNHELCATCVPMLNAKDLCR